MSDFLIDIPLQFSEAILNNILHNDLPIIKLGNESHDLLCWGDPIFEEGFQLPQTCDPITLINKIFGHYYYILINKNENLIMIGSSLFNILPVYYSVRGSNLLIGNNVMNFPRDKSEYCINKRFIFEMVLFNYPLFNDTIFQDVKLLDANSYIKITNGSYSIIKHTHIENLILGSPISIKDSVGELKELFIHTTQKYFPKEKHVISLTGGFDGRTLVSTGLYHKRNFDTYSFGTIDSNDTAIAAGLAIKAGINYIPIHLDNEYINEFSLECGKEFIINSSGTSTFARAHYLYAAKVLANDYKYIISGNFGSEVLRTVHRPGVMLSGNLFELFRTEDIKKNINTILNSSEAQFLRLPEFKAEIESFAEDLKLSPSINSKHKELNPNQRLYIFVLEEVFRKYFGAEVINQSKYIKNRTPFLDIDFLKKLLRSKLSGVHSEFRESNPLKRYKGQLLYSHVITSTFPLFAEVTTDKGYKPKDLLSISGRANIVAGYFKKKLSKQMTAYDPQGVTKSFNHNKQFFNSIQVDQSIFNFDRDISSQMQNKVLLYKILSINYFKSILSSNSSSNSASNEQ